MRGRRVSESAGSAAPAPLRLTRRGRLVVVLVCAVVVLALTAAGSRVASGASSPPAGPVHATMIVQPGQTLWTIAQEIGVERDVRDVIHEIEELNGLPSARIRAGQRLIVPTG